MASSFDITMDWSNPNKSEAISLFKQQCEMLFRMKKIKVDDQVDQILLRSGVTGIKKFNSWGLKEEDKKKPDVVWSKFMEYGEGTQNYRIARLSLRNINQKMIDGSAETVEEFIARCRLQAQLCKFKEEEIEERIIEQLISGTVYQEVQKELLSKDDKLTLDEALQIAFKHEASLSHMQQLVQTQSTTTNAASVNAVRKNGTAQKSRKCQKCGTLHPIKPITACPAHGTKCRGCGRMHHWESVCKAARQERYSEQKPAYNSKPHYKTQQGRSRNENHKGRNKSCYHVGQEEDEEFVFDEVKTTGVDTRDEVFAKVSTRVPGMEKCKTSLRVKVDTGAQGNILPLRVFKKMPLSTNILACTNTILTAYNGTNIPQQGVLELPCKYKDSEWCTETFFVADTPGPIIMGLPSCRALNMVTLNCAIEKTSTPAAPQQPKVNSTDDLQKLYPQQFDRVGHFKGKYHIVLDPDAVPVIHAPRKCPIHLRDELKAELEKMKNDDIIMRIDEPTEWVNSLAYSRKSNGQLRICLDPKDLNQAIRRCHHKTPTLEELTYSFSGAKFFSKLDAKNGYWAVELDEESQKLTTFNSPFGRFCFKRMPFGLVMSQDVYQSRIDQIVEKCPGVVGIADDMVVYGSTEDEHDKNLHNLMRVAQSAGLVFNSKKCGIKLQEIPFFGHLYDRNGARPDPKKVEDIKALPAPSSKQQVQEFLGMVTYLSPFITHLSQKTAALRDLLKQDCEFQWNASHQKVFQSIKDTISQETTLIYFDPRKPTTIQVDASSRGLGAALLQDGRPIAFASKSLTEVERRYANIEREMLAVVFGCKRFHTYVFGKEFSVESDHKPLEMITAKNITSAPPRLQRMLLEVQGYDFKIKYRPGKEVMLADGLSRLPNESKNQQINLDIKIQFVNFTPDKLSQLKEESRKDEIIAALKEVIVEGWPEERKKLPSPLRQFWSYRDQLTVEDTLVLNGDRIFIPEKMRDSILAKLHASHQGVEKTRLRARTCVYWPSINDDIDQLVRRCNTCQEYQRSQQKETLIPHEIPSKPWEMIGTDLFYYEGENYLIVADYYSKFFFVKKVRGQCTSTAVVQLTKQIFSEQGVPSKVISDNGRHYSSECYREFAEKWGFIHVTSSPYYPQSNGFIERTIQTVKNTMKKCKGSDADIALALLCVRTTPITSTIPSPAELLYSRKIRANLPVKLRHDTNDKEAVYQQMLDRQQRQKEYHDRSAVDLPPLYAQQPIFVQHHQTGRWEKGTINSKCDEPRSYNVAMPNGNILRRNRKHLREREPENETGRKSDEQIADTNEVINESDVIRHTDKSVAQNNQKENNTAAAQEGIKTRHGRQVKKPTRYIDE